MDHVTVSWRRMNYTRLCVGVYQGTDMPKSILLKSKLGIWDQHIEYESIPFTYFHCKKSGHWAKNCPSLMGAPKKVKKVWVRKVPNNNTKSTKSGGESLGVDASQPRLGIDKEKVMGNEGGVQANLLNLNSDNLDKAQGKEESYPKKGVNNDSGLIHKDISIAKIFEPLVQYGTLERNFVRGEVEDLLTISQEEEEI